MAKAMLALGMLTCLLGGADGLVARGTPVVAKKAAAAPAVAKKATPAEVLALHKQLATIAGKFSKMLNAKDGALANAKVGPEMKVFVKELQAVLKATSDPKLETAVAMSKLQAAKQGLASLMGDLNSRQTQIMKEDNSQRESLMLGVLMTNQKKPMEEQLKILKDGDFAGLEVAKALLAKHDAKIPLYVQAAGYLDAHPKRKSAPMVESKAVNPIVAVQGMLEKHLYSLEHEFQVREKFHQKKVADLAARLKSAKGKSEQHTVHIMQKREERNFKKFSAMRKHDIKAMKDAVEGVKKGDLKAVGRAQAALQASLKSMQSTSGGFLYLIQMGHTLMKRDCPYCAAQCVDKCHTAGNPYVQCLTQCADAGKN